MISAIKKICDKSSIILVSPIIKCTKIQIYGEKYDNDFPTDGFMCLAKSKKNFRNGILYILLFKKVEIKTKNKSKMSFQLNMENSQSSQQSNSTLQLQSSLKSTLDFNLIKSYEVLKSFYIIWFHLI